ncbi:MAG: hypothetical protein AAF943_07275 [Pseudomonadota bacterium]
MIKTAKLSLCAAICFCIPAYAMGAGASEVDANGDGILSVAEVQAVFPDVTVEQFAAMDLNSDGALDDNEVQAAQDAGLMPTTG